MTIMFIVGGVVLGLLVFLLLKRKVNRAEKLEALKGIKILCVKDKLEFEADKTFIRSGLRGDLFRCPQCGARIWRK